jgi:hypothetical protein
MSQQEQTRKYKWKIQKARTSNKVVLFHEHDGYPHVCLRMEVDKKWAWMCINCREQAPSQIVTAHNLARL